MATFALLVIIHVVASNWQAVTGGRQALVGLPRYTDLWVALAGAAVARSSRRPYGMTRHGLALRCSRENEVAAAATGIDIERERLIAFVLSAIVVAMGGVLFSHFLGTMTANTFYLDLTFVTLTMLVIGGMRSLTGACVGVALVSIVSEVFRSIERGIELGDLDDLGAARPAGDRAGGDPPGDSDPAAARAARRLGAGAGRLAASMTGKRRARDVRRPASISAAPSPISCSTAAKARSRDLQVADHAGRVRARLHRRAGRRRRRATA